MEAVHSAMSAHAHDDRPAPRAARRRRFEQDTPAGWVAVIPLVMASTIAVVWWAHALAHAR